MNKDEYKPRGETARILERALEYVHSVSYSVSARYIFYRLLQEGYYTEKGDYGSKFLKAVSRARHACYGGWRPDTLSDDTRECIERGDGHYNEIYFLDTLSDWGVSCSLDKWYDQPNYVELWFEARAMARQFQHYTRHITLVPMGGQPSIPYKYETAQRLMRAEEKYDKPIIVLYFGDLDEGGEMIAQTTYQDIGKWCDYNFEFIRCGLTMEQVQRYNVPENPEKPGEYQWEALEDEDAGKIIETSVAPYVRLDAFSQLEKVEKVVKRFVLANLEGLTDRWLEEREDWL